MYKIIFGSFGSSRSGKKTNEMLIFFRKKLEFFAEDSEFSIEENLNLLKFWLWVPQHKVFTQQQHRICFIFIGS